MSILYLITICLLGISLISSPAKTFKVLQISLKRFIKISPSFIIMLILVSFALYLTPKALLENLLANDNKSLAVIGALGLGSFAILPGFIVYPLCGILLEQGALYIVLSAFSTTLMMVGIVTFPLEKSYLGFRLALSRNLISFAIAVVIALVTGIFFGEMF